MTCQMESVDGMVDDHWNKKVEKEDSAREEDQLCTVNLHRVPDWVGQNHGSHDVFSKTYPCDGSVCHLLKEDQPCCCHHPQHLVHICPDNRSDGSSNPVVAKPLGYKGRQGLVDD